MEMLAVALLMSMVLCLLFGVPYIDFLRKKMIGQYILDLAPENHAKKAGTPTTGGVFIVLAIMLSSVITLLMAQKIDKMVFDFLDNTLVSYDRQSVKIAGDKVYYFVRQQDTNKCGFLTAYNILSDSWDMPVEIEDCQSRGDFIYYKDHLYLFHAPIDREHIGIVKIDTENIVNSQVVLQAKMHTSCFYPFVQYYTESELAMSYTVARKHIRLAKFTLSTYLYFRDLFRCYEPPRNTLDRVCFFFV